MKKNTECKSVFKNIASLVPSDSTNWQSNPLCQTIDVERGRVRDSHIPPPRTPLHEDSEQYDRVKT